MTTKHGGRRQGAGRPTGARTRATAERKAALSDLAKAHTAIALKTLVDVCKSDKESGSARVAAANALLDRAYGKPTQAVQHTGAIGTYDLTRVSDADLDRLETILGPLADAGGDQGGEDT